MQNNLKNVFFIYIMTDSKIVALETEIAIAKQKNTDTLAVMDAAIAALEAEIAAAKQKNTDKVAVMDAEIAALETEIATSKQNNTDTLADIDVEIAALETEIDTPSHKATTKPQQNKIDTLADMDVEIAALEAKIAAEIAAQNNYTGLQPKHTDSISTVLLYNLVCSRRKLELEILADFNIKHSVTKDQVV